MTQFRRNHSRSASKFGYKLILVTVLLVILIALIPVFLTRWVDLDSLVQENDSSASVTNEELFFLPKGSKGKLYCKETYCLSYVESNEQAEWVAYKLTRDQLKQKRYPRPEEFDRDAEIVSGSADRSDYRWSGYTRGHLVPAADRSYNEEALRETFLYSNISPQLYHFNGAVWRELEECTRDWAYKFGSIYVVSGPHIGARPNRIGPNGVAVPEAFWKVVLDIEVPEIKAAAFWIPHQKQEKTLDEFMITVDELERLTGLDFFADLIEPEVEIEVESVVDTDLWPYKEKRYLQRIHTWNQQ